MNDVLLYILGLLIFAIGIGVSIALHEVGHLVPAKRFGVKVTQYMVGFGPTLWSRRRGETEYGLKAIPLGGYIRMIGMFPPARNADGTPGDPLVLRSASTGRWAAMIDDARRSSLDEIAPADVDRVFYRLPVHRKLIVMLGGPVMNLLIAAVLFTIAFVGIGALTVTTLVGRVSECVPSQAQVQAFVDDPTAATIDPTCDDAPSPAAAAGIEVGDRIVRFDGTDVARWDALGPLIRAAEPGPVEVVVERDGQRRTITADLVTAPRPVIAADGQSFTGVEPGTFFGVGGSEELVPQPLSSVPDAMWTLTVASAKAIATMPVKLYQLAQTTFGAQERDPAGLVGVVGVSRISGEVASADSIGTGVKAAQLILLLAGLNLFLFLFNLVPLLPLDGGHAAGALWEGTKRKWARLRKQPDPGPVDIAKALPLAYGVSFVLIAAAVLIIYADLVDPIRLGL